MARADYPIDVEKLEKIALFCDVEKEAVIPAVTAKKSIYEVPMNLQKYKVAELVGKKLGLGPVKPNMKAWQDLVKRIYGNLKELKIALVGKYTGLDDAYLSVIESLRIACYHQNRILKPWIEAEKLEKEQKAWAALRVHRHCGARRVRYPRDGRKILAAQYARKTKCPTWDCAWVCNS